MRLNRTHVIEGPVGSTLIRLTLPMVGGLLTIMLFNVVDTFFIARLGPKPLAAIGFTFPIVYLITGTTTGLGIGVASVISRVVGEGDQRRVAAITTHGLLLALVLILISVAAGLFFHDALFRLLGADEEHIGLIRQYMLPWFLGVPCLVVPMIGTSAIRATGDSFTPSLAMMIAGGVNVVLDPLLIFGLGPFPRWELQGAALATVASYMVALGVIGWVLVRRERMIRFERLRLGPLWATWASLLHIGAPAVMTNLLVPLSNGLITRILAGFGPTAVAAFGVGSRIESLLMVGAFAMSTVMVPFAGQNFGAQRPERVRSALRVGLRYCLGVSLVWWLLLALGANTVAGWFATDPVIVGQIRLFLWLVPLSYGGFGYMLLVTAAYNGAGLPRPAMLLFGTRLLVFTVPLAWLGGQWAGVPGVFAAMCLGNIGSGLLSHHLARRHPRFRKPGAAD